MQKKTDVKILENSSTSAFINSSTGNSSAISISRTDSIGSASQYSAESGSTVADPDLSAAPISAESQDSTAPIILPVIESIMNIRNKAPLTPVEEEDIVYAQS